MIVSLNEMVTVSYRAALGAGLGYGLAEDAAAAAARLATADTDVAGTMLSALRCAEDCGPVALSLKNTDGGVRLSADRPLPALRAGPAIADLLQTGRVSAVTVTLADDIGVVMAAIAAAGLEPVVRCEALAGRGCYRILLVAAGGAGPANPRTQISVTEENWRNLLVLAARTYVPASEVSRLRGAGAGLSDSD